MSHYIIGMGWPKEEADPEDCRTKQTTNKVLFVVSPKRPPATLIST